MAADGITRAACFVTSAYSSYSSCRQYRENLFDAVEGVENAPHLDKLRHYFNHPGFVEPVVDATLAALAELPDAVRDGAHLVFVTHSIPLSMNEGSGPDGGAYVAQHRSVATEVVERVRQETGRRHAHELVYCSRSGAAHIPLARARHQRPPRAAQRPGRQLGRDGAGGLRVRPHGGHLRPRHRGRRHRREAGAAARRAATPGVDPRFVSVVRPAARAGEVERGGDAVRAAVGSIEPLGPLPGRLLPEPARPAPGPVRVGGVSEELAGIALDVARAAAELVRGRAARGVAVADTKTSDTDVVTEADRASETLIRRSLRERRPDDAFLGEEGAEEAGTSESAGSSTRSTAP